MTVADFIAHLYGPHERCGNCNHHIESHYQGFHNDTCRWCACQLSRDNT